MNNLKQILKMFSYIPQVEDLDVGWGNLTSYVGETFDKKSFYYQIQYKETILLRIFFKKDGTYRDFYYNFCTCKTPDFSAKIKKINIQQFSIDDLKKLIDEEYVFRIKREKEKNIKNV